MLQLKKVMAMFLCIICFAGYGEEFIYPGAVKISDFRTDKVIYKPGEQVTFTVGFTMYDNHENNSPNKVSAQIWLERELEKPALVATKEISSLGNQKIQLQWNADKNVFGHRARVRFADGHGRVLAEQDTLFDVAANWVDVMRMVSEGAKNLTAPGYPDATVGSRIEDMRAAYFNALEMFTFSPKPYQLAPEADKWLYQYQRKSPKSEFYVTKERLQYWGGALHKNGMKYIAYNETSAAYGPDDWKTYQKWLDNGKTPYAHYFKDDGMFVPNMIKIADLFAKELSGSTRMFGWDGILMDSAIDGHKRTAEGMDKDGKKLTDLTIGEVGYKYLENAAKATREVNPDFRFLSQNATSVSHIGVKLEPDKMYPWIIENAKKMNIKKYSELVDLYTLEIDSHNEPRDGRYPLTYEKMSIALNSVVEVTGRPLMSWAFLATPFNDEYSVAFLRPYMAIIFASRTKIHDHFDACGGAWSEGRNSPVCQQFIKYNRFMARFSYYLWDPKLTWKYDINGELNVSASRPLFWNRTVYERSLGNGKKQTVINLLNLPSNGKIVGQQEIPPAAQDVELKIRNDLKVSRVTVINADDYSLEPLDLIKNSDDGKFNVYRIPPVSCWSVVIVESNN